MRISPVFSMLVALGVPPAAAQGQARHLSPSSRVSWSASAISLGMQGYREWRPAMTVGIQLSVRSHFDLEVVATGPLGTRRATTCADAGPACTGDPGQPEFTILTASVGVHTNVRRFRPFLGFGPGRITVKDVDGMQIGRGGIWLLYAGADVGVAGPLSVGVEYRASRVGWRHHSVGVTQEVAFRLSVGFLGVP